MNEPKKPKRRWYQYSLRTLFVFVLVAGVGFGLLGRYERRIQKEREARAQIRELGGTTLRPFLPPFYVDIVLLDACHIKDEDLECLKVFANLGRLSLNDTQVTDAGLEHLKGLTELKDLDVRGTQVTEQGVKKLRRALTNCRIRH